MHVSWLLQNEKKSTDMPPRNSTSTTGLCVFLVGGSESSKNHNQTRPSSTHHSTRAAHQLHLVYSGLAIQYLIYLSSMHLLLHCITQLTRNKHGEGSSRILISVSASSEAEVQSYYAAGHQLHFYIHNYDWSVSPRLHTLYKGV